MKQIYEVLGAGFDGGADGTDDRVLWVRAESAEQVQSAIKDTGASMDGPLELFSGDSSVDFELPQGAMMLGARLLEFAGEERNKNRWTPK